MDTSTSSRGTADRKKTALISRRTRGHFLGKIVRLDINHTPGQSESSNHSKPEISAMGLSNPRGCRFDSSMPSYFYCGDVAKVYIFLMNLGCCLEPSANNAWP